MKRTIFITYLLIVISLSAYAQQKKVVTSVSQLPKHSYKLPADNAEDIINNRALLNQLTDSVQKNILSDLKEYDIRDNATLKDYYTDLRLIAFLHKDYKAFDTYLAKEKDLADKEAEKTMKGCEMESLSDILRKQPGADLANEGDNLKNAMIDKLKSIDFSKIQESVESLNGRTDIYSANFLNNALKSQLQPVIDNNKGVVTLDVAVSILSIYYLLNYYVPAKDAFHEAYAYMIKTYGKKIEKQDIWKDRNVTLSAHDKLTPVVIGIWDAGVDVNVFPEKNRWVNSGEKRDGIDDDKNGFVDDINGVGYDMYGSPSTDLLIPEGEKLTNLKEIEQDMKGIDDINASISSEAASKIKKKISELDQKTMKSFMEQLSLYGEYAHGTHVSGIAIKGNPAAKILVARLEFDYHSIPFVPNEKSAHQWADMFGKVIDYFKVNGVKVVNMSWTVGLETEFLRPMEANGYGQDDQARMDTAKKLFAIEKKAFVNAAGNAPDILFVCAAGNNNNDVDFAGEFPASLDLPNQLTVGAVDIEGKKTSFTTEGKSVDVYADGYEVESYVPGGDSIRFSGTSMASPQVVNLAAKLWAVNPKLTVQQVKDIIIGTATKSDEGILLIDPAGAVQKARSM